MTQQEYEQKKRECWEEAVLHGALEVDKDLLFDHAFKCGYALGKEKEAVTQEDVEDAAKDYAYDIDGSDWERQRVRDGFVDGVNFALGKQERDADTVIQGWVARDKKGTICLYNECPERFYAPINEWGTDYPLQYYRIPDELFPDLTWEDDPIESEIILKRKKK